MRDLLVVIDMQNDFIDGALGTPQAQAIVDPAVAVISSYDPRDIFATRDTHPDNYMETQEGRHLPVKHCIRGSEGWQINERVARALRGAQIIDKPSFGSTVLAEKIAEIEKEERRTRDEGIQVTLLGLCTDICVVSNALLIKAFLPETPVRVIPSCCAGVTPQSHQAALETMRMCQVEMVSEGGSHTVC